MPLKTRVTRSQRCWKCPLLGSPLIDLKVQALCVGMEVINFFRVNPMFNYAFDAEFRCLLGEKSFFNSVLVPVLAIPFTQEACPDICLL